MLGVFFWVESKKYMQYEQGTTAVIEFYRTERLPLLEQEILTLSQPSEKPIDVAGLTKRIAEYNQALDLVHGKKAPYVPHYALETSGDTHYVRQFIPAFLEPKHHKGPQVFIDGPAKGMLVPKVVKEASYEDQPTFDISFLTEQLNTLTTEVQNESYPPAEDPFEIVLYDSQYLDETDLDNLEEQYTSQSYGTIAFNSQEHDLEEVTEEEFEDYIDDTDAVEIFFDENVEPGMLLIELYDPINEVVDALYVPHIPMNFRIIMLLMTDYIEIGGAVQLIFSEADRNNNLIIPVDPTDPDSDEPINPLLN